jgi:hypothetical protein
MKTTGFNISGLRGDISSDGNKVWVNMEGGCVARFCKLSGEVYTGPLGDQTWFMGVDVTKRQVTTQDHYDRWCAEVDRVHHVTIPKGHMPVHIQ